MRSQIDAYCSVCLECSLQNALFHHKDHIAKHLNCRELRASWSLDLVPRINTPEGSCKSIMVAVDNFTKFTVRDLLDSHRSKDSAKWFLQEIVANFGISRQVRVDNGIEWADKISSLLRSLNINLKSTQIWPLVEREGGAND